MEMSEEKKVLSESEQEQIRENTVKILNDVKHTPAVPIQLIITGRGGKGRLEVRSFLEILEPLRDVKYLDEKVNEEVQTIQVEIKRKQRTYELKITGKPLIETYETPGGMMLQILDDGKGGLSMRLRENLGQDGRSNLGKLINILKTWANVENINIKDITGSDGGKIGSDTILEITRIKKLTSLEERALAEAQLYMNMRESLFQTMKEVEKKRRLNPKGLLDEIQYYTNLGIPKFRDLEMLRKLGYSLKELYSIIEIEHNVTMDQIRSNKKPRTTAENRHALMYLCYNRFKVSSSELGVVFAEFEGTPKNHATVLEAQKLFDKSKGIPLKQYSTEKYTDRELYYDVQEKRLAYLKEHPRKNQPEKLTMGWIFGSPK